MELFSLEMRIGGSDLIEARKIMKAIHETK